MPNIRDLAFEPVLNYYAQKIFDEYISLLQNSRASGTLIDTASWKLEKTPDGYNIVFVLEDYYYYLEFGRKPGTFPPVDAIKQWIRQKPILPTPMTLPNGRQVLPTENQLAFLIGRKIKEEGIEAKHYIDEAVIKYYDDLVEALGERYIITAQEIIDELTN